MIKAQPLFYGQSRHRLVATMMVTVSRAHTGQTGQPAHNFAKAKTASSLWSSTAQITIVKTGAISF
ncbi:hypothetical protein LF95_22080 [Thalassospira sp. TSL5-1]|nr:hypothetical protein LF95_22080 [Thalassospira sp. TSL5-1]